MTPPSPSMSRPLPRIGARDLFVAGSSRAKALAVYDSVDAIKVTPAWAMARVGGVGVPQGAGAVRGARVRQRRRQPRRTRRTTSTSASSMRPGRSKSSPRPTTMTTSSSSGRSTRTTGRVHAEHRRAEPRAARQPQQHRRRVRRRDLHAGSGRRQAGQDAAGAGASAGDRAAVHALGSSRAARNERLWSLREAHAFEAGGPAVPVSGAECGGVCARRLFVGACSTSSARCAARDGRRWSRSRATL